MTVSEAQKTYSQEMEELAQIVFDRNQHPDYKETG